MKYTGDGFLALMPSATSALDAARSIRDQLGERGLRIRVGLHVGDVDVRGDDVSGLAVNIAARIMAQADADETLVSEAARQATLGSSHRFEGVRTTDLKGIPGQWTISRWVEVDRTPTRPEVTTAGYEPVAAGGAENPDR